MAGSASQQLAELYARHGRSTLRLAFLMTGDRDAAEELAQEAFVRVFARLQNRRAPEAITAYLRRTVINLSHDRHRRLRSSRAYLEATKLEHQERSPELETRLDLRARLRRLPHRQRAALVLRYYEDLSERQAADILQCSVPALRQLVRRGVVALRADPGGAG
jgi:RNA polymerase sigma factor (sigma-70 family)